MFLEVEFLVSLVEAELLRGYSKGVIACCFLLSTQLHVANVGTKEGLVSIECRVMFSARTLLPTTFGNR